jgi:hypothetical protein
MDNLLATLERVVELFGPMFGFLLLALILGFGLLFAYLVLDFGHKAAVHALIPFVKYVVRILASEKRNPHPAIRVEFQFHMILILVLMVCFLSVLSYVVIPWRVHVNQEMLDALMVSCFVVIVIFGAISFRLASRL